ncbi:hypothetical protein K470DRAFT_269570 [Piedraia hortae CBS 480.64]|uniref:Uncharacterized protein n=1 Tax=Piedraia hortae CBS 480.64 TaxID=1314780 RepID=A0A6A7C2E5_9PEZI|nr:hypothetical protein K470DRAFT_269570 [Piedraia hortae CBS 480.64]
MNERMIVVYEDKAHVTEERLKESDERNKAEIQRGREEAQQREALHQEDIQQREARHQEDVRYYRENAQRSEDRHQEKIRRMETQAQANQKLPDMALQFKSEQLEPVKEELRKTKEKNANLMAKDGDPMHKRQLESEIQEMAACIKDLNKQVGMLQKSLANSVETG